MGLDRISEVDHGFDQGSTLDAVDPNFESIEYLEGCLVGGREPADGGCGPEEQHGSERQVSGRGAQSEGREEVDIGQLGEHRITAAAGEITEPAKLGRVQILDAQIGQREHRDVLGAEASHAGGDFVRRHGNALGLAVDVDGAADVETGRRRHQGPSFRDGDDHDRPRGTAEDLDVHRHRWRGLVGHQSGKSRPVGAVAVPGPSTDNGPVVVDTEDQPPAFTVREAHHGLDEPVVVDVGLELDAAALTTLKEFVQLRRHHRSSLRRNLRVSREITNSG